MNLICRILLILLVTGTARAQLNWSLASGNESWPAEKRAAIVAAMNEAVALYNANGYFPKTLWANYNPSVPTAQASYSGWIDFGGQIGTRTALHEISHTLGVGQYSTWSTSQSAGKWTGTFANNRVKLFDGTGATIGCDTAHFWPYGLNYANEDSTTNRVRHIKMVSALRRDMGIVSDSDVDGIPNDWEMFHFGDLTQTAAGDFDGDGVSNLAEYNADTNPAQSFAFTWNGGAGTWDTTTPNWTGAATRWRNGGNDTATFEGAAGTVTVAAGITANDIIFNTTGYEIAGASLTLTGLTPTITTAANVAASVQPVLGGSGGLVKNGAGTLTLGGSSSFTGPLTVNAGTLAIAPGGRLYMNGGSTVTTINPGATLTFTGNWGWNGTMRWMGVAADETVINGGTSLGTGAVSVIAGDTAGTHMGAQLQITGGITLANPTVAISGLGSGAANGVLRNISGNNTILGAVQLTSGAGGSVIASDAGKLTLSGGITPTYASRTIEFTGAGNVDVTGPITNGTTAALPLTKSGAGTLTLSGANTHSGTTTISGGVLQIGANGAGGTLGTGAVTNNAMIRFHRNDTALVVSNPIGGTGALEFGVSSSGSLAAETTLGGANTFTGNITVLSGGVRITRSDALGTGTKSVTMTNGTNGNCRLILDGSAGSISLPASLSFITSNTNTTYPAIINEAGNNTISGNFSLTNGGGSTRVRVEAGTLTLDGQITPAVSGRTLQLDGAGSGTFSGALKNSSNSVGLEKSGTGTWTLTGTGHTYTGATTINEGRLALTGSLASTITVNGGIFAPQGTPSTSGGVNVTSGGRFEVRINGPTPGTQYDRLNAGNSVTLGGALDIVAGPGLVAGADFNILNKTSPGTVSGTFAGLPSGSHFTSGGYTWTITYTGGDGNDVVLHLLTPHEQWRLTHFGTTANTGPAADGSDPNGDDETNLIEFATAQNPHASTTAKRPLVTGGPTMKFTYTRSIAALADGVTFAVEWSGTLAPESWSGSGVTEEIISDDGTVQTVEASIPAGTTGKRFIHLKVSSS